MGLEGAEHPRFLTQRAWSRLAADAGFGRIVYIKGASGAKVASYVTKALPGYVTKDLGDPVAFPRHFRRVRFSRGWAPDWVVRQGAGDQTGTWELVRPGTSLMSVYLRATTLDNRADPDGWAVADRDKL
jgi:hypothetical protein